MPLFSRAPRNRLVIGVRDIHAAAAIVGDRGYLVQDFGGNAFVFEVDPRRVEQVSEELHRRGLGGQVPGDDRAINLARLFSFDVAEGAW